MICLVVALSAEARPLISHYRLEKTSGGFRIHQGERVALVVSGIGKTASAAATGYLFAATGETGCGVWLNVGVAGHRSRSVGQGIAAHAIIDQGTGHFWRLRTPDLALETDCVRTVDRVEEAFGADGAYDMEAAGFYPAAIRCSHRDLVQCFKVISDNRASSFRLLDAKRVESLIEARMDDIVLLADTTLRRAREMKAAGRDRRR